MICCLQLVHCVVVCYCCKERLAEGSVNSSQCFAIYLSCLVAQGLRFFMLIFKVPRGLHPKCIFELLMPCIPFQSWRLGERDFGPEGFLKWIKLRVYSIFSSGVLGVWNVFPPELKCVINLVYLKICFPPITRKLCATILLVVIISLLVGMI